MKSYRWLIAGVFASVLIAVGSLLWATRLMDSIFAYRSPLRETPPQPGGPVGPALTRRVVFVLIDGLRGDTSHKNEVMPFLNELRQQGAWAAMHSRPPSFSQTGYGVLLTGAWPNLSDAPAVNLDYADIPTFTQDNLFSAAQRAGLKTALSGYFWFEKLVPQGALVASFYTSGEDAAADGDVMNAALPWLRQGDYALVLIHLDQVDYAGHHEGGPLDPRWDAAARRTDDLLRQIAATLDFSQDTLFVCSDHGHIDAGGHGGNEPVALLEPFVLVGAGVIPGAYGDVQMVDVAPTLAALLGANIPASSQGQVLTSMLALSSEQQAQIEDSQALQQVTLSSVYAGVTAQRQLLFKPGGDPISTTQAAITARHNAILATERLPRAFSAVVLTLAPLWLFLRPDVPHPQPRRRAIWLFSGAAAYTAIFHLGYAVLAGRTYSLSSLRGVEDMIVLITGLASAALCGVWLAVGLGLGSFRLGPQAAATDTLALIFTMMYWLSLPIWLHFMLNGAWVTWALPEFTTAFVGFISLLQIVIVSILGLLLIGLAALLAKAFQRNAAEG